MNSSLETGFLRTRTRPRLEVETSNVYVMFLSGEVLYEGVNPAVSCDVDSFVWPIWRSYYISKSTLVL